jgi:hypothetical protein
LPGDAYRRYTSLFGQALPSNVILTKVRTQFHTQRELNWRHIPARCRPTNWALTVVRVTIDWALGSAAPQGRLPFPRGRVPEVHVPLWASASLKRHPDEGQDPVSNSTRIELAPNSGAVSPCELGPDRRQGDDNDRALRKSAHAGPQPSLKTMPASGQSGVEPSRDSGRGVPQSQLEISPTLFLINACSGTVAPSAG